MKDWPHPLDPDPRLGVAAWIGVTVAAVMTVVSVVMTVVSLIP